MIQRVVVVALPLKLRALTEGDKQAYLAAVTRTPGVQDSDLEAASLIFESNARLLGQLMERPPLLDKLLYALCREFLPLPDAQLPAAAGSLGNVVAEVLSELADATLTRFFRLAGSSDLLLMQYLEPIRRLLREVAGEVRVAIAIPAKMTLQVLHEVFAHLVAPLQPTPAPVTPS